MRRKRRLMQNEALAAVATGALRPCRSVREALMSGIAEKKLALYWDAVRAVVKG